jgi:hypothetical protein
LRRVKATALTLIGLFLLTLVPGSIRNVCGENDINQTLVTAIYEFNRQTLDVYQWQGVKWVIFYNGFSKEASDYVHSLGMKAMVYVSALKEPGSSTNGIAMPDGTTVIPDQSWAQYVYPPQYVSYMYPDTSLAAELWFSPYGPYVDQVVIPKVQIYLSWGADGIFLDTVILYGDANGNKADDNPTYAHPVWMSQYPGMSYQDFRYQSLHDCAKKIYTALKTANPNAVLVISDNNVCVQPDWLETQLRDRFASAIDKWQDGADGFVLEYVGLMETNNPTDPLYDAQAIVNTLNREKSTYGVTKTMWPIGFTNRDDAFEYMESKSVELGFGYWAYDEYLLQPNLIIYNGQPFHIAVQSDSSISNFKFDRTRRLINFTVSGNEGSNGFTIATIPTALLDGSPIIMLNNEVITPTQLNQNSTHYTVRVDYHYSVQQITIGGANTIPEFQQGLQMPILALTFLIAISIIRKRNMLTKRRYAS